jgi:1,4-dihydroxy-2-naphthoate octaprenyltransferase
VAGVAGVALSLAVDLRLLVVGVTSFAAGWLYTGGPKPYGYAGLGEVFVFVFFGLVATAGSAYVQTESITGLAIAAGVPVGFLATALLVVNNLRDIPGDTAAGKRTLAVRLGERRTRFLYVGLLVGAVVAVPAVAGLGSRPLGVLALAAVPLAQRPVTEVLGGARGAALIPALAATGRVQLVYGLGLAAGLWLSG